MAQDDYYYEIQLTNKQLVFYFMAGATGLILSFLAGVMVGRGVDTAQGDVQARNVAEEKVISEESAIKTTPSPDLTYAQRLESDRVDAGLERPKAAAGQAAAPAAKPTAPPPTLRTASATPPTLAAAKRAPATAEKAGPASEKSATETGGARPEPAVKTPAKAPPPQPSAPAKAEPVAPKAEPSFTIQVGAFKDRATADGVVTRLKGKGFAAYILSPDGSDPGLFVVRVGHYAARADAERAEARLRDQEKFKPFITNK
jgi:cell division septation protein DedD